MAPETAILSILLVGIGWFAYPYLRNRYHFWRLPTILRQRFEGGKYREVIALLEPLLEKRIFENEVQQAYLHYYLIHAYQRQQQHEQVVERIHIALQIPDIARTPGLYLEFTGLLAHSLLVLNREEEARAAISRLEHALENNEKTPEDLPYWTACYALQYKFAEAADCLEQRLEVTDGLKGCVLPLYELSELAHYYALADLPRKAWDTATKVLEVKTIRPEDHLYFFSHLCDANFSLGRLDEAEAQCKRGREDAEKLHAAEHRAYFESIQAAIHLARGEPDSAAAVLERAREQLPNQTSLTGVTASLHLARGEHAKAVSLFQAAIAQREQRADARKRWYQAALMPHLAHALLEMGQDEEASAVLRQAFPILKNVISRRYLCESLDCWAESLRRPHDPELQDHIRRLAERLMDAAESHRQDTPISCFGPGYLGIAACNMGDYFLSLRLLDFYERCDPYPSYTCLYTYQQGVCYERLERFAEARTTYERCIAMGIDVPRVQKAEAALARLDQYGNL